MYSAVHAATLPAGTPPAEQLALAAAAGLQGIELLVTTDGPLTPDTPPAEFARLDAQATERGLTIVGLATPLFWQCNYAAPDPAARTQARDLTLRLLDQAAAARGGSVLVIPAVVGRSQDARPAVAYADALHRTYEALLELRRPAEARGVTLAIENVWNRFLLSPVEAADLIDRINSPCVGFYLDVGNVLAYGYPADWIATLGGRLARVHVKDYDVSQPGRAGFCGLGEGSMDWPAVLGALRGVGYDGPLTYEGAGDVATAGARLRNILAGRPPLNSEVA